MYIILHGSSQCMVVKDFIIKTVTVGLDNKATAVDHVKIESI